VVVWVCLAMHHDRLRGSALQQWQLRPLAETHTFTCEAFKP
jgi:hypothetical protein